MHYLLFLLLVFSNMLEGKIPYMNYWDELAAIVVIFIGFVPILLRSRLKKSTLVELMLLAALVIVGGLGNVFHPGLQSNSSVYVRDLMALIKFPLILIVMRQMPLAASKQKKIIHDCARLSRFLVLFTAIVAVVGYVVDIGVYTNEIRIVKCFRMFFTHPTFFVSAYLMVTVVLTADSIEKNKVYILLSCLLIFMAQRTKGYAAVVIIVFFTVLGEKKSEKLLKYLFGMRKEKIKASRMVGSFLILAVVFYVVGKDKLQDYIRWGLTAARPALYIVGFQIMVDYFPIGSGFGTFASWLSGVNYSRIYEIYNISHVPGITRERFNYISDVFWPYIYGQFGFIGLLIYLKLLIDLFVHQLQHNKNINCRLAVLFAWSYAAIASTSEAYFTNTTGVQVALVLGLFIGFSCGDKKQTVVPQQKWRNNK